MKAKTPEQHQLAIAKATLKMTPAGARVMGGMDYETAYELVFKRDLRERLKFLIELYGDSHLDWELKKYGWRTPAELLSQL